MNAWNYLQGYVIIKIEGSNLEKLINLATMQQITLWDIERGEELLLAKIQVNSLSQLRPLVKKTKCTIRILQKVGFPFFIYRFSRRQGLMLGFIFFLLIIYLLSSFVWFIDIQGNKKVTEAEIGALLRKNGLYIGQWKHKLNLDKLENTLMVQLPGLAWADVQFHGTKVEVRLEENTTFVQNPDKIACLVAAKDGLVTELLVIAGQPLIAEGDTVKKGQILITGLKGTVEGNLAARGKIKARIWSDVYLEGDTKRIKRIRTGQKSKALWLKLGKHHWLLRGVAKSPYQKFVVEHQRYDLPEQSPLPFGWLVMKYYQVEEHDQEISLEQLQEELAKRAVKIVQRRLRPGSEIIHQDVIFLPDEGKIPGLVRVKVLVEALEDIGKTEELIFRKEGKGTE